MSKDTELKEDTCSWKKKAETAKTKIQPVFSVSRFGISNEFVFQFISKSVQVVSGNLYRCMNLMTFDSESSMDLQEDNDAMDIDDAQSTRKEEDQFAKVSYE